MYFYPNPREVDIIPPFWLKALILVSAILFFKKDLNDKSERKHPPKIRLT